MPLIAKTPTTKPKQRTFVDALIDAIAKRQLTHRMLLKNLRVLRRQLHNRKGKHGRISAPRIVGLRGKIVDMHRRHPEMSWQEIAIKMNISNGRVSETLRGKRT